MDEDSRSRYSMLSRGSYRPKDLSIRKGALKAFQDIKSPRKQEEQQIEEISYKSDLDDEPEQETIDETQFDDENLQNLDQKMDTTLEDGDFEQEETLDHLLTKLDSEK